ncbi:MAG TPA: ion channel [Anaeromyxobacteraceae bacterium]|nr:ion channel [Anaeromyxobacteraceae bacterium]
MARRGETRVYGRDGARDVVAIGLRREPGKDVYHYLLTASWKKLILLVVLAYVGSNAAFGAAYLAMGDVIEGARPGDFWDAFFFSVQTMATIGYGKMAPATAAANALVAAEALLGLMALAVVTGLVFAKFSRPTARVIFSRVAVVTPYERVPSLMLRMANERANQIVEAQLHAVMVRNEQTAEGDTVRRVHDLALRRSHSTVFALSWTAIHPITPQSALHGEDQRSMAAKEANIIVSLTGYDESLAQTVYARHVYTPDQVVWGARFRDIMVFLPDGLRAIDYRRFHDVVPLGAGDGNAPAPGPERTPGGAGARD